MSLAANLEKKGDDTLLRARIQPKASFERIQLGTDGTLKIAVTAPAVENAANKAVIEFLAKLLKTNKNAITLTSGTHSRGKAFLIKNISESEVLRLLEMHTDNG